MKKSAAIPASLHGEAVRHLVRADGQEDLCFALWNPSVGARRTSILLSELLLPREGERTVHGNVSFDPSYFERAVSAARQKNSGLALLHSHLGPGWQGMSPDDVRAEQGHAGAAYGATDLPLVGLTVGTDGAWSARCWERVAPRTYKREWFESVRVVGGRFTTTFNQQLYPTPEVGQELTRTVSAWGEETQASLARLRIGIVGAGSVGAIIAETLARMGVANIDLFDFDVVEEVNLDRLLHATRQDALERRFKVDMLAHALKTSSTAHPFHAQPFKFSIVEESGFRAALDCDILFSCVDRPWARHVLNFIAYAHLIPVVDGGILLERRSGGEGLRRGTWRAHVCCPGRTCLECLGQYEAGDVSLEQIGLLDDPSYITNLPTTHRLRVRENVFAFSLSVASMEIMQFLRMIIDHPGHPDIGAQTQHFVSGLTDVSTTPCNDGCPFVELTAQGDRSGVTVTGRHLIAETARLRNETASELTWLARLKNCFKAMRLRVLSKN